MAYLKGCSEPARCSLSPCEDSLISYTKSLLKRMGPGATAMPSGAPTPDFKGSTSDRGLGTGGGVVHEESQHSQQVHPEAKRQISFFLQSATNRAQLRDPQPAQTCRWLPTNSPCSPSYNTISGNACVRLHLQSVSPTLERTGSVQRLARALGFRMAAAAPAGSSPGHDMSTDLPTPSQLL